MRPDSVQLLKRPFEDPLQFDLLQYNVHPAEGSRLFQGDFQRIAIPAILVVIAELVPQGLPREPHDILPPLEFVQMLVDDEHRLLSRVFSVRHTQADVPYCLFGEGEDSFAQT